MSLSFYIFKESFENKKSQIESYQLFQETLKSQTEVTNNSSYPLLKTSDISELTKFFKDCFFRFYSLYEITMTKYIDLNIYTQDKFSKYDLAKGDPLENYLVIQPEGLESLQEYFLKGENEEEEAGGGDEALEEN